MGPISRLLAIGTVCMGGVAASGVAAAAIGTEKIADNLSLPPPPKVADVGPGGAEVDFDMAFRANSAYGAAIATLFAAGFGLAAFEAARKGD